VVRVIVCWLAFVTALAGPSEELRVVAVEPSAHSLGASVHTPIVVRFDRPVNRETIDDTSFWAFGRWSGAADGSYAFSDGDRTVTLVPGNPLSPGESVMVILSHDLQGVDGSPMRGAGYSFQFWTRAQPAVNHFTEIDRLTTRTIPSQPTQAYGGIGSDLNGDGYLDVTIVNEISEDLRVFLNQADGSGALDPFLVPAEPVGDRASPSEPSDFNRDGFVDIAVANINDDTVSILLGNGDGTYAPQQTIAVGLTPRGIAVLDVDGDGDVDIANTNTDSNPLNMSVLLNDGSGVFGPPTFFAAGATGAWALAAGDMDDDGILDLVIGARASQRMVVRAGQGNGTFALAGSQLAGGAVWMLVLGDVNGDGTEDVATVNSTTNTGAILLGDGAGGLGPPQLYPTDPFSLATDLGDLDGDSDLDWITSSFSGDWWLYANDGAGSFALDQTFEATSASSCSLMLELDNDGDLDLVLIDEIADELILLRNSGFAAPALPADVPDGDAGTTPLTVAKLDAMGAALALTWDTATCHAASYHLVYGSSSQLPASPGSDFVPAGGRCGIGTNQPFQWLESPSPSGDPTGLLWFVMLANDGATTEGSWGTDGAALERSGPGTNGASDRCGMTDKDVSTDCATTGTD
jgi:hypothetical protein